MSDLEAGFLRNIWKEYCQGCSIYAMRHLMAKLHFSERIWWIFWIGFSVIACLVSMVQLYDKWNQNPVLISYDHKFLPVWAVPFPAVTVCPMARAQSALFNASDVYLRMDNDNVTDDEYLRLRALLHVCPMMSDYYEFNDSLAVNFVEILQHISIPFNSLYAGCQFRKYLLDCRTYWSRSITDGGVCYTFNAIDAEELLRTENLHRDYLYSDAFLDSTNWTLEDGYLDQFELETYPLRPIGGGLITGLMLVLMTNKMDIDYVCEGPTIGYKVAIHAPDEMPSVQNTFFRLSHQNRLSLIVQPELTYITHDLKKHPYTKRRCYFSDERYLRYFRVYNRKNCLEECISNLTAHECGCVGFYSPRGPDVPICDGKDLYCPDRSFYMMLKNLDVTHRDSAMEDPCGCLPSCTTLKYVVELSNLPWDVEAYTRAKGASTDMFERMEPAALLVALKSKWTLPLVRQELFGVTDMMAMFGGLFVLAMGASVISLLELVYYCFIRPWRNDYPDGDAVRQVFPWVP